MKTFEVEWTSPGNITIKKRLIIRAEGIVEAQDKFFDWLKKQPVYEHMWCLNLQIAQAGEFLE